MMDLDCQYLEPGNLSPHKVLGHAHIGDSNFPQPETDEESRAVYWET